MFLLIAFFLLKFSSHGLKSVENVYEYLIRELNLMSASDSSKQGGIDSIFVFERD